MMASERFTIKIFIPAIDLSFNLYYNGICIYFSLAV